MDVRSRKPAMVETWPTALFEDLYRADPDPWRVTTSAYERRKYATTLDHVGRGPFGLALELGCAIGIMSRALAARCDRLVAVDTAATALDHARRHCADCNRITFHRAFLPAEFPALRPGSCDLVVISELLYFLSPADIRRLADRVLAVRRPGGPIVLANWTGPTDTPCGGDDAAALFVARCRDRGLAVTVTAYHDGYRLDRLS
ncbi:Methyltransferase type 12 [Gluconacetobacter diazotrophicus PA1 5]|uniref:class I SAM-dependent methyltransferase n=1 Tax=Gluconacetobacter diazotrophicus TaxID=33996 RepID=UPI000173B282|nr:class I SAM-dependent methyltransferase [Gluconacetobacter diazotrophicus]ACI50590.1 Methyltransferase type 12 [Gluconacetobacter diazotrophicus PA1 5]TWB09422.1 nodulation protein S (NodS) [Gluconacetobacter diazotrophicus]